MEVRKFRTRHERCSEEFGRSALVGLAVMVILMPVPAKIASMMQGVQKEKMKAVRYIRNSNMRMIVLLELRQTPELQVSLRVRISV